MRIRYLALALLLGFLEFLSPLTAETLNITGAVWCPHNCYADKEKPGIMFEIAEAALGKKGYQLNYTEVPWTRAVQQTRKGKFDALIGSAKVDAPDFIYPEQAVTIAQNCFFVRKNYDWKYNGISSLSEVVLGIGQDESLEKELDDYIQKNQQSGRILIVSGTDYLKKILMMLKRSRVSAIVDDVNVINYWLKKTADTESFKNAGCYKNYLKVYLGFSPALVNSTKLIKLFDEGVQELRQSGEFQNILDRYNAVSWE